MGMTGDIFYDQTILEGLDDENIESRIAAIQAMGMIDQRLEPKNYYTLLKIVKVRKKSWLQLFP